MKNFFFLYFAKIYDVRKDGNWNGDNVLNRLKHQGVFNPKREGQLTDMRLKLVDRRRTRTAPARDDKVLTDWNAMTAVALIEAAETLERDDWKEHAQRALPTLFEKGSLPSKFISSLEKSVAGLRQLIGRFN